MKENCEDIYNLNFPGIESIEKKVYASTFSRLPLAVVRGEGMYLWDICDKKYLDMFSGIAVSAIGHAHPALVNAVCEQSKKLIHVSNWLYTLPQLELAKLLIKISGMQRVFFTNDGTEAVETSLKLAHKVTGKKHFIAAKGAFHGRTLGSLSATYSKKARMPFKQILKYRNTAFVNYNDIDALESAIRKNKDKIAAVIVEPVQGESGVIIPDDGYLAQVRRITRENDVLMIADEIQTGFGRCGRMFACEYESVKPDIMCVAKGIGGGFPLGAALFRQGLDFQPGEHGGTYLGGPLACAASKAVIETIISENLVKNSEVMGRYILENLIGEGFNARGRGLMIGIDVEDGKRKVMKLIKKGILTIFSNNTVRVLPPLIVKKEHADEFLREFRE